MSKTVYNHRVSRPRAACSRFKTLGWALAAFTLAGPALAQDAAAAAPEVPRLGWNTDLEHFQVDSKKFVGQRFTFQCPERAGRKKDGRIFGTDVYSSDSPICLAALHAGVIRPRGGRVTVQLNPGIRRYVGSKRNGLKSSDRPATKRSMVFVKETFAVSLSPMQRKLAPRVKWNTKFTGTGLANRKLVGQRFVFKCPEAPAKLPGRRVYGTDRYAFNSYICLAAVHAGRLTRAGGFVTVQLVEPEGRLVGSMRNGVESKDGAAGNRQLIFRPTVSSMARALGN